MRIALAQTNSTVGDLAGNARCVLAYAARAHEQGADVVVFPELALTGYPPRDLLEKQSFLDRADEELRKLTEAAARLKQRIILGVVTRAPLPTGNHLYNSAVVIHGGQIEFRQNKMLLPTYDVFDEARYFHPSDKQFPFEIDDKRVALTICEDAWNDKNFWPQRLYPVDPVENLMHQGATLIVNLSASPYYRDKREMRRAMLAAIARRHRIPVAMVNQVGGNDSLIFDGSSLVLNEDGETIARARSFQEDMILIDFSSTCRVIMPSKQDEDAAVYDALVLGTRDYVRKCGFSRAIVGLSGGIDSALVATIASEALGAENVLGVGMPSEYSSQGSIDDARQLAQNLGIQWELIPVNDIFQQHLQALQPMLKTYPPDITEENLQSRIRGTLLMALSNKLGALVLTTGNKSEMSTGYCTLYGDMVGALAVIADVYKTCVYRLARYANRDREIIPENTLVKPPSAELRPGQQDTDSLPPYEVLDPILEAYVERYETAEAIVRASSPPLDIDLVRSILRMVERSEYKRQQAAPVLKVTQKSFGVGRRFPIAAKAQI